MSGEVVAFPSPAAPVPPETRPCLSPDDMVLICINATLGLWCVFPVALVDDDGVVLAILSKAQRVMGVDRVNCAPDVYGFAARDHEPEAFLALRWKSYRDPGEAVLEFAGIGVAR